MPNTDTSRDASIDREIAARRRFVTWRSLTVTLVLLTVVLMATLPPLLNVGRFKRRIVTSISTSLGRPVHLDTVSLVLLPFPGFKLENFVVAEDPNFGSEPVIHASSVMATLRFSSLWSRKVEFSRISLQEPSINLVHDANGRWNIEGILLQASHIPAAPTAQAGPSAEPRFPYIEATGARLNIKSGLEKLPFSLTESDFAVWLPNPRQWRVRLVAKPTRTDTNASDTGTISLEGSLGHAERFDQIPLELAAEWKNAPLGEASRVLTGRDAGLRGDLRLNVSAAGTIGSSLIKSSLALRNARRASFVPDHPLDVQADCQATSAETFHAFHQIRCAWPPAPAASISIAAAGKSATLIAITGDVPDIHHPASATVEIGNPGLPTATVLNWLRVASPRVPPDLTTTGALTGSVSITASSFAASLMLKDGALAGGPLSLTAVRLGDLDIASAPLVPARTARRDFTALPLDSSSVVQLAPVTVALGAKEPATLEGHFDTSGYTLHLSGNVLESRLLDLAAALPQFGDGLEAVLPAASPASTRDTRPELPIHVDLTSSRPWLGGQTWSKTPILVGGKPRHRLHR